MAGIPAAGGGLGVPLIMAGAGIAGNMIQAGSAGQANRTNIMLAAQGQNYEREMWNKNNEYNSPTAQMERLKAAGLNPNLIYGNGSASTGISSSYPRPQVAKVEPVMKNLDPNMFMNVIGAYQNLKMKDAQINQLNQNSDLLMQKRVNEGIQQALMELGLKRGQFGYERDLTLFPTQVNAAQANLHGKELENRKAVWELEKKNPLTEKIMGQQIDSLNPALVALRKVQAALQELQLKQGKELDEFGLSNQANSVTRMVVKASDALSKALGDPATLEDLWYKLPYWVRGQAGHGGGSSW